MMWGVAADTQLSCWRTGRCIPVAAMILGSLDMRKPERNPVGDVCCLFVCFSNKTLGGFVLFFKVAHCASTCLCHLLEQVVALDAQIIVAVSCGEAHTLALNDKGQVFSWGLGSDGQLGLNNFEECVRVPR